MTIVKTIISLAHSLDLKVIAEGVESMAQLDLLNTYGCDEVQGFYFSKPVPADELACLLGSWRVFEVGPAGNDSITRKNGAAHEGT
ncbi:Phytochrome-like protein cph2 [compost metagenome]